MQTCRRILNGCTQTITRNIHINMSGKSILCLFDVDGTLTQSRKDITPQMKSFLLKDVAPKAKLALVGGSDYNKISEQMGGKDALANFEYVFSENGLIVHKNNEEVFRKVSYCKLIFFENNIIYVTICILEHPGTHGRRKITKVYKFCTRIHVENNFTS